jgi:hypothetical protein
VLLVLLAVGLAGFALWRFVEALGDPDHRGREKKALAFRFGFFVSGLAYAALAVSAVKLLVGLRVEEGGNRTRDWTAWALELPLGRVAIAVTGLIIVGVGISQIVKAVRGTFQKEWKQMESAVRRLAVPVGRVGLTAFGLVFGLVGFFLFRAALTANAGEARGVGGALEALREQAYGPWLLTATALGLFAYGLHLFVEARYRRLGTG